MSSSLRLFRMTLAVVIFSLVASLTMGQATVTSDKEDYAPRSTAIFTGAGFTPGETVVLRVKNLSRPCNTITVDSSYQAWSVIADATGRFVTDWLVCDCVGDSLRLKAAGQTSGLIAYAYFTDANVVFNATGLSGTPSITVRYRVYTTSSGPTGVYLTKTFNYGSSTTPAIPVTNSQTIEYSFSTVLIGSIVYNAPGGTQVGNNGNGQQTITAAYCTPPVISAQPISRSITYGANATFTVAATGSLPFSYQWQEFISSWSNITNGGIYSNATTATLTLTRPTVAMSGRMYRCIVTNTCGSATTDGVATLTVNTKSLNASFTAANKVYDGNTSATISTKNVTGVLSGDVVVLVISEATFADENVGTGKTVTATGFSLSGAAATNYSISNATATAPANITAKPVTVTGITVEDKQYDGTATATADIGGASIVGRVDTDDIALNTTLTASFSNSNVGDDKTVTISGLSLTGTDAGNYILTQPTGITADITPKILTAVMTAANKVYDGNTTATIIGVTLIGVIGTENVHLSVGTANFEDKNVGTGKEVTGTNLNFGGGDKGHYSLGTVTSLTTTADITPKTITGSFTASNKVYDGTIAAAIATRTLSGVIVNDAVSLTGGSATFDSKTVGTGKTVTAIDFILSGIDAGNYSLGSIGTTTANITPLGISGSFTAPDKEYDGNINATVLSLFANDVIDTDVVNLVGGTASFSDKNVGDDKVVTLVGASIAGDDALNYTLNSVNTTIASITAKAVTASVTASDKIYDGNNTATISSRSLSGVLLVDAGEVTLGTSGTATFSDANVGTAKIVTATDLVLSGTASGNYSLVSAVATTNANISALGITGSFTASNKIYDGNTTAAILMQSLSGVIAADASNVSLTGGSASFDDANAGDAKTVTASGMTLSGTAANNYSLTGVATTTADITTLGITGNFTSSDKVYDGSATATVVNQSLSGVLAADASSVNLSGGSASFDDANAGNDKTVTASGMILSGSAANNYHLTSVSTTTADITPLGITGTFAASSKVYDGNTTATVVTQSLSGVLAADASGVSLTGGSASFDDANAGTGKTVTASGMILSGSAANNYHLTSVAATTADITALGITGSFTASDKVYDGNATAAILTQSLSGVLAADVLSVSLTGGSASFDNSNAGTGKTVTGSGMILNGSAANNYQLVSVATTTANITTLGITGSLTASNKVYDGNTAATVVTQSLSGVLGADASNVSLTGGSASFDDANAGTAKIVTASGMILSGSAANNYHLISVATTTADITPLGITGIFTASDKVYDGNAAATVVTQSLSGVLAADASNVSLTGGSASYGDANAGTAKTVTASGMILSGSAASNYHLTSVATTTADITALGITGSFTASDKVYDGNIAASVLTQSVTGVLAGDLANVNLTGGSAFFDNPNAGLVKTVTATGMILSGSAAGNYTLTSVATTTAAITAKGLIIEGVSALNKVYDGNTTALLTGTATLIGVVSPDVVTATGTPGASFATSSVGIGKLVTVTGYTLGGPAALNYTVSQPTGLTADITPKILTITNAAASNKVYDQTNSAIITGTLDGVLPGEVVGFTGTGTFAQINVAIGIAVISTATLTGNGKDNYLLTQPTGLVADITPKPITITSAQAVMKVYDGNTSATISGTLSGIIAPDGVSLLGTGLFASPDVGIAIPVTSTSTLSGPNAGNYVLVQPIGLSADITPATTTVSSILIISSPVQYSDKVSFKATIVSPTAQAALNTAGGVVEFRLKSSSGVETSLGTSVTSDWNASDGTISKQYAIVQAPGSYTVMALFTPGSNNFSATTNLNGGDLTVNRENARLTFTGTSLVATQSATSGIGVVTLRASVQDITAVVGDPLTDDMEGNISKARVRFSWATTGAYTPIVGTGTDAQGWLNVSLVNSSDIKNGTVQLTWTRDIGSATSEEYSIRMEVDGYYVESDDAVVTVYKASGDYITGGGYIKPTQASGSFAPGVGTKTNFGFSVKYGNGGKSPKGNMNIIYRRMVGGILRTYQIKANAMTSLGVDISDKSAQKAVFVSKANLQDITNPNSPQSLGGNLTLQLNMTDRGEPGSMDGIGIQLWDGTNLLYSSSWINNDTRQLYLSGGNLKVVSSFNVGTVSETRSSNNSTQGSISEAVAEVRNFNIKAYPNPAVSQFTVRVESDNTTEKIRIRVFDLQGKLVQIFTNVVPNTTIKLGGTYNPGVYFIEMMQGNKQKLLKLMKQSD